MKIEIGNAAAIEGVRDEEDGQLHYQELSGERVTTFVVPDDFGPIEAVQHVIATLPAHMRSGSRPAWIECDDQVVLNYLCQHYGVPLTSSRPTTWGGVGEPGEVTKKKRPSKKATAKPVQETPEEPAEQES